jgi:hypothetical protein
VGGRSLSFIAAFTIGTAVAKTISKGLVDPAIVDPTVVLAALLGAIVWNLVTWYVGLPAPLSHCSADSPARPSRGRHRFAHPVWMGEADPRHRHLTAARRHPRPRTHRRLSWLLYKKTARRSTSSSAGCSSCRLASIP